VAQAAGTLRRNFQGYTTDACETLLGFGASAIGRVAQGYMQNEVNLADYARRIETGSLATARGYQLSEEDHVRAAVIERLMCDFAADVPTICARHGFDAARLLAHNGRLAALAEEGVVSERDGVIRVEATNRFLIRTVAAAFDAYLEESDRVYSKTA
jgi:oxygen-independent coproporphyrinogen-3 oxidase